MIESKEQVLEQFAKNIIPPSDEVYKDANSKMDKVFKLLQRKSRYSLDRFIAGGSAAKHTATQSFDFDCLVFINNELPKFEDIIDEFEDILNMSELSIKNIEKTPYSVQFQVSNVDFDLLPASNLVQGNSFDADQRIKEQQKRVIEIIEKSSFHTNFDEMRFQGTIKSFSSSLAESHVQFMKGQDAFTHELARLAKFWNKTLFFDSYISGKSTIIELIAVDAAIKTIAQYGKPNFIAGFRLFLDQMTKLDSINLTFQSFWPKIKNENKVRSYKCPIILEPNNPYNNMGNNLNGPTRDKFKFYAYETLNRMKHWSNLEELFEPQPRVVIEILLPTPKNFLVGVCSDRKELSPTLIVQKKDKRTKVESKLIEIMRERLFTSTHSFTACFEKQQTKTNVRNFINKVIDKNIMNRAPINWTTCNESETHESREYTMVVPYKNQINGEAEFVVVSFDLQV